ncbi:RNase adapter RapZ [Alkalicella caledoniensis]|uniref:RNase adapter RapZ n=1 Tax=Alkalicella caledoniensis TaxID=2731377 RepID=A0A7G9W6T4_ALKCA|nr:RNase adapter RapZ [Alkalicella caledoniensis]QNO14396.1 RNase adapter RapZ [Alkalicella caledoniensis]
MEFVILTGMSGAGKTLALRSFEDMGYFCIDNLPPALIPKFADLCNQSEGNINKVAIVVDIRGGLFFKDLQKVLENMPMEVNILFLEANDDVIIRRFKETKRSHPLALDERIIDGINKEKEILEIFKDRANLVLDTSNFTGHQLIAKIKEIFTKKGEKEGLSITIMSFGFKYGIPIDSDMVFDVRFLPNPFYDPELKHYTGNDKSVQEYVMAGNKTAEFLQKLEDMVDFLIPCYVDEGKSQLVISIGCTGGKHRSVTISNKLKEKLERDGKRVKIYNRDIDKGK